MNDAKALAVALMPTERDLIISALRLVEEFEADTETTRPLIELLEKALTTSEARRAAAGMMPALLDAKGLQAELGISRAAAERIMQSLPIVRLPSVRKVWVKRCDVERLLTEHTYEKHQVPI